MSATWETDRIAELIREYIATSAWSQQFTTTFSYAPFYNREDLTTLAATVVPALSAEQERVSRGGISEEHTISIGFQVAVEPTSSTATATIKKYTGLMQEVVDHFRTVTKIPNYEHTSSLTGSAITTDPEMLRQHAVFTGYVELRFKVLR